MVSGQSHMEIFQPKLKELKKRIKDWNHSDFGNIHKEKHALEGEMWEIQYIIL